MHPHAVALALRVLLNDDRVGARRHWRAGEDAGGFAGADMPAKPGPGRHFGDDPQFDRDRGQILGAHRVAVHRRYRERRLRPAGSQILGQNAADRIDDRDLLERQLFERREQARQRLFNGDHGSASQIPDLPPDLRNKRRSVTTMPRSTALHIS